MLEVSSVERAAESLKCGRAVVFPTDTVYGVGVAVGHAVGPGLIYELKRRERGKPIAWLVGGADDLDRYAASVPPLARKLAHAFWPGALTLIVKAGDAVPRAFQSPAGTIGLRMPASDAALELIAAVGCPLAATSANFSGERAPQSLDQLDPRFARSVGCVVGEEAPGGVGSALAGGDALAGGSAAAGGAPASGVASTIVDCTGSAPVILREGCITVADIEALG